MSTTKVFLLPWQMGNKSICKSYIRLVLLSKTVQNGSNCQLNVSQVCLDQTWFLKLNESQSVNNKKGIEMISWQGKKQSCQLNLKTQ